MITKEIESIREDRKINNYKFPLTRKIKNFLNKYQYNQWKVYKEELIQILLDGIKWCEKSLLEQSENPNWCDLLENYYTLLFEVEKNGLNPEESKERYKTYLITKAKLRQDKYSIFRKQGLSDGQAVFFFLPEILEVYVELQNKYRGFETNLHDLREEILKCQKNSASDGVIIKKKFDITQDLNLFISHFKGNLINQLYLFCNLKLPNFDVILGNMTKVNDVKFHVNTSIFDDNLYGDRIIKGQLSENDKLIEFYSKEQLRNDYDLIERYIYSLFKMWREFDDFQIILNEFFKNSWLYHFRLPYIKIAITYYLESDYVVFLHLIIPQIEGILRDLLHFNKISIYREKRSNISIQEYLLAGEIISEIRKNNLLNSDLILLIELYLFDPLYKNLRHNTLHGFNDIRVFNENNANILLLILLHLTQRKK